MTVHAVQLLRALRSKLLCIYIQQTDHNQHQPIKAPALMLAGWKSRFVDLLLVICGGVVDMFFLCLVRFPLLLLITHRHRVCVSPVTDGSPVHSVPRPSTSSSWDRIQHSHDFRGKVFRKVNGWMLFQVLSALAAAPARY